MRLIIIFFVLISFSLAAQDPSKICTAHRVTEKPKIDGIMDDPAWSTVTPVSDFIMNRPKEGGVATEKTEVRVVYDDYAVFVFATMLDDHPEGILHELGNRDDANLNADFFRFVIDPYNLRQDAFDFGVYASGVQADSKFSDPTFNAVWKSAVTINDKGWCVEMEIPYSAIRFPKKPVQEWALQTTRYIRRTREFDQWALTPSTAANAEVYWGTLKGITDIKTPLRLSLTPYVSTYVERTPEYSDDVNYKYENTLSYNAGADIKYGIDDRFTLDMTLLPDFGQVQSDNKVKNLSYQETIYNENRTFFKEGTDIFSKNNLFYTRRIGKTPDLYYDVPDSLKEGEVIKTNPSQVKLLNAMKISGRTNGGTGIGLFNAVTDNTYAEVQDEAGNKRKILTEPLTNYNVLVFDQQLNDYSNIYFINTSVIRAKKYNDANVSSSGFTLADKKNKFAVDGNFALSQQYTKPDSGESNTYSNTLGYKYFIGARKISGIYQYGVSYSPTNDTYNQLDLGYYTQPRIVRTRGYCTFNWFQPWHKFRDGNISITVNRNTDADTHALASCQASLDVYSTLVNYWSIFFGGGYTPFSCRDYYEPRVAGRFYNTVRLWYAYAGISTDYRKAFAVDLNFNPSNFIGRFVGEGYTNNLTLRYRFTDKFTLKFINNFSYDPYNLGVADYSDPENIIFGVRILHTYENILSGKYIFKNDMALTLNARHYWSTGQYRHYFDLLNNGNLVENDVYGLTNNNNYNYNVFNIDLVYSWQFSPGSNLSIVYKNSIETQTSNVTRDLLNDFQTTLQLPQTNSISLKLIYYLDYQALK